MTREGLARTLRSAWAWLAQLGRHVGAMNAQRTDGRSL
jgi:hypothetical protein